jgi:hypothetical protein
VFSSQPGLTNQPNSHADIEYLTDDNNFVWKDTRFSGYAVVTLVIINMTNASPDF